MSAGLIIVVGLIYLGVAADQLWQGSTGMSVMYVGYAIGNVGAWLLLQ